ncbi:MAG: PIN domain-containing protein [Thermoplasmatota archaeon]
MKAFFFDTYALVEVLYGNENYRPYLGAEVVTTKLNLMEMHYHLLKEHGEETADRYYDMNLRYVVDINDNDVKNGMRYKIEQRKKWNISYVDAVGYVIAKRMAIKFLTGDQAFEGIPNVEYVK